MSDMTYEAMGRYIYGAYRYGGNGADVARWIADDLGVAAPAPGDAAAVGALFQTFLAKYSREQLQENHARFMAFLQQRPA